MNKQTTQKFRSNLLKPVRMQDNFQGCECALCRGIIHLRNHEDYDKAYMIYSLPICNECFKFIPENKAKEFISKIKKADNIESIEEIRELSQKFLFKMQDKKKKANNRVSSIFKKFEYEKGDY